MSDRMDAVNRTGIATHREHLIFLDVLRSSGVTNMYGAGPYLEEHFGVSKREAQDMIHYWMKTFRETEVETKWRSKNGKA